MGLHAASRLQLRADFNPLRTKRCALSPQQVIVTCGSEYNIFRWYRAAWGRYSQADPIGLAAGINAFRYSSDDPIAVTDPTGLVSSGPAVTVYHPGSPDDVYFACNRDPDAHGCTRFYLHAGCTCGCEAGQFRAHVTLSLKIDVFARTDDPQARLSLIESEEAKHVRYLKVVYKWAIKRAEDLEAERFHSKPDCDEGCKAFWSATKNDFSQFESWVHENNPHPY